MWEMKCKLNGLTDSLRDKSDKSRMGQECDKSRMGQECDKSRMG